MTVSYFFVNLFVSVMFNCFHRAYIIEKTKGLKQNKVAEQWWDYLEQIETSSPNFADYITPDDPIRLKIFDFINNNIFDSFILIIILLNLLSMAINFEDSTQKLNDVLNYLNLAFTSIFIFEMVVKLIGLGPVRYFKSSWNQFDFFVVIASLIDIIVTYFTSSNSQFLKSFQIIRVLRVLRVTR